MESSRRNAHAWRWWALVLHGTSQWAWPQLALHISWRSSNSDLGDWPEDADIVKAIDADFSGLWGDRRQEIVFIGEKVNQEAVNKAFDHCLLTAAEMRKWEKVMKSDHYTLEQVVDKLNMMFEGMSLLHSGFIVVLIKCV